jgi:hypothetical protein
VTVLYNLARLAEQGGKLQYADMLYRCILKQRPNYTDAFTRLGQIRYPPTVLPIHIFYSTMALDLRIDS